MQNPFETIEARLCSIEAMLQQIKDQPNQVVNSPPKDNLLTVQQAAEFLKLSVPTIYSKVSRGELPFMKTSKRLYFSQTELFDYVRSGSHKTNIDLDQAANNYFKNK